MRRLMAAIAFPLALVAAASPVQAANPAMAGTYVLDRTHSDDVNRAIEQTVSRLSFVTRPIARGRLRRTNQAYQRIVIAFGAADVSIAFDQRRALVTPANGTPVDWTREDGEKLVISTQWQGSRLEQTFKGADGRRANAYSLSADGRVLTMDVTVTSPRLSGPMTYKLVFTRAG
ncbi:MAG: hypothetical protein ACJ8ER_06775 [Allosphingosinicella sp.]